MRPAAATASCLISALLAACGSGPGGDPVPSPGGEPITAAGGCSSDLESPVGKLTPDLLRYYVEKPGPRRVLIVHKRSADIQPLPECTSCGSGCRQCPEREAAIAAIDRMVMELQRCTVARIQAVGGEFLERFWLGNIIHARLDRAQALEVARLVEVRLIEDSEAPGPPPPGADGVSSAAEATR